MPASCFFVVFFLETYAAAVCSLQDCEYVLYSSCRLCLKLLTSHCCWVDIKYNDMLYSECKLAQSSFLGCVLTCINMSFVCIWAHFYMYCMRALRCMCIVVTLASGPVDSVPASRYG